MQKKLFLGLKEYVIVLCVFSVDISQSVTNETRIVEPCTYVIRAGTHIKTLIENSY